MKNPRSDIYWVNECDYISRVTALKGNVKEMNNDKDTFMEYCKMQKNTATKQGYDDSAQYIQHCLDDLA